MLSDACDVKMVDILADNEVRGDVMQNLRKNWPRWAARAGVSQRGMVYWLPQMAKWWLWLQNLPKKAAYIIIGTAGETTKPGWYELIDFIQAYTGTTILNKDRQSMLTRMLKSPTTWPPAATRDVQYVKFMLSFDDIEPNAANNMLLRLASRRGDTKTVEMLLGNAKINPAANDNEPLRNATRRGHVAIVGLLFEDGRVDPDVAALVVLSAGDGRNLQRHRITATMDELNMIRGLIRAQVPRTESTSTTPHRCAFLLGTCAATDSWH